MSTETQTAAAVIGADERGNRKRVVGIVVDGVSDVIALTLEQIRPAPQFSTTLDVQYITGLGTVDQRMLILVDIEKLMTGSDMGLMDVVH